MGQFGFFFCLSLYVNNFNKYLAMKMALKNEKKNDETFQVIHFPRKRPVDSAYPRQNIAPTFFHSSSAAL